MTGTLSGPMFEPSEDTFFKSVSGKSGGHYNSFYIKDETGMEMLRQWFPDGEANEFNQVLFSTSGVHGTYQTIEEIEASLLKYGDNAEFEDEEYPDDYKLPELTVVIIQPRLCTMRHGNVKVRFGDIQFLKTLRQSSWDEFIKIGRAP